MRGLGDIHQVLAGGRSKHNLYQNIDGDDDDYRHDGANNDVGLETNFFDVIVITIVIGVVLHAAKGGKHAPRNLQPCWFGFISFFCGWHQAHIVADRFICNAYSVALFAGLTQYQSRKWASHILWLSEPSAKH
jgi:hypothetical protein